MNKTIILEKLKTNHCCEVYSSLFTIACFENQTESINDILAICTDVDVTKGYYIACRYGNLDIVKEISGLVSQTAYCQGIKRACEFKHLHIVHYLLTPGKHALSDVDLELIAIHIGRSRNTELTDWFLYHYPTYKFTCFEGLVSTSTNLKECLAFLEKLPDELNDSDESILHGVLQEISYSRLDDPKLVEAFLTKYSKVPFDLEYTFKTSRMMGYPRRTAYYLDRYVSNELSYSSVAYPVYRLLKRKDVIFGKDAQTMITKMENVRKVMGKVLPISSDLVNHIFEIIYPIR